MAKTKKDNHETYPRIKTYAERLENDADKVTKTHDRNGKVFGMQVGSYWIYLNCETSGTMIVFDERHPVLLDSRLGTLATQAKNSRNYKSSYTKFGNKGEHPPGKAHSGIAWMFDDWRNFFTLIESEA